MLEEETLELLQTIEQKLTICLQEKNIIPKSGENKIDIWKLVYKQSRAWESQNMNTKHNYDKYQNLQKMIKLMTIITSKWTRKLCHELAQA